MGVTLPSPAPPVDHPQDPQWGLASAIRCLVDYQSHTGERPMSIVWRLHEPIPASFLPKTNKLVS